MSSAPWTTGTPVAHSRLGRGSVLLDRDATVVVRFDTGIEECPRGELRELSLSATAPWSAPLPVLVRSLGLAIRSVSSRWGVFARSRIDLLPHQLWVCRKVLEEWPSRWLVADDVGLGKTIEAGLILTPLLSSGRIRRLLVLCPASLVQQWQSRLREMFDIRLAPYLTEADRAQTDFWGTHPMVVASAHTLRRDLDERWERLLEAEPWDMVIVDEAHHLGADAGGASLAWQLVAQLESRQRIQSMLFFTGTPHRGKDYGFLALLRLLRPDLFDPKRPASEQYGNLRDVMIRNNKRMVTDMDGKPLFTPISIHTQTYSYSPEETLFYEKLTEFISDGRAYASTLNQQDGRFIVLVLIAMQKLASSSVAAVARAIRRRVLRLENLALVGELENLRQSAEALDAADDLGDTDARAELEERIAAAPTDAQLLPNEIAALKELLALSATVLSETKVERLLALIEGFTDGRQVLLFTEYKATQALVFAALEQRFGPGCSTFINGDGFLEDVPGPGGSSARRESRRETAAESFNQGRVRFLVSTEAAGEGIDLQERCSTLVHIDLPWNPMRMHQRVGRLSRYGQKKPVEVYSLRNPDTLESQIWECLDAKLKRITEAFSNAMDDPEDMLQLVLGMSPPGFFEELYANAPRGGSRERLSTWFDSRASEFGGVPAVKAVEQIMGSVARFDFGSNAKEIPRVDLPDLLPFMKAVLVHEGRRGETAGNSLSFVTPDAWRKRDWRMAQRYDGLMFERPVGKPRGGIGGVGHIIVDAAIAMAESLDTLRARVPELNKLLLVFSVWDRVTSGKGTVRKVVFGVEDTAGEPRLLLDWELIRHLNEAIEKPRGLMKAPEMGAPADDAKVGQLSSWFEQRLPSLGLPFSAPEFEVAAMLVPANP